MKKNIEFLSQSTGFLFVFFVLSLRNALQNLIEVTWRGKNGSKETGELC
jgi:hypothetical protein